MRFDQLKIMSRFGETRLESAKQRKIDLALKRQETAERAEKTPQMLLSERR